MMMVRWFELIGIVNTPRLGLAAEHNYLSCCRGVFLIQASIIQEIDSMAGLDRVTAGGRDCWQLRFYIDKRRSKIGLSDFDEAAATVAKSHIEHLVEMRRLDRPADRKTTRWLQTLPTEIYDRLAKCKLVEPRAVREQPKTALAFMRAYIKGRSDWKKPANYEQAINHLETFIKRDVPLGCLTKGDVERWLRWMTSDDKGPGLSTNTAGQNVKRCRQMMRSALDDALLESNPFAGVKIDLSSDKSKNRFIDRTTTIAILEACPNQEWRVLFALARFGGLRCPSEVLSLRWSDIVWDRGRLKVTSPKTARYGKGERVIPLWPELLVELDSLFAIVAPGTECPADAYVIQSYRCSEANLRTQMHRIASNAAVAKWPKPFMALRASRRTELERSGRFANHVLNDWFGHSGAVAETHYLQTTEDDFLAAGQAVGPHGDLVGPSQGNQESLRTIKKQKKPGDTRVVMVGEGCGLPDEYTQEDSNL